MRPRRGLVILAALALAAAACGSRLPDSAFRANTAVQPTPSHHPTGSPAPPGNSRSDVGVTAYAVRVGILASETSPLGAEAFSPPMYGARAYFDALNSRGGVHGRQVQVSVCDDGSSGSGDQSCVHHLID